MTMDFWDGLKFVIITEVALIFTLVPYTVIAIHIIRERIRQGKWNKTQVLQ